MNQAQRNFLIDKIKKTNSERIEALKKSKPDYPNISNFLFNAVMTERFDIISNDAIKELIRQKAITAKSNKNWLNNEHSYSDLTEISNVSFKIKDFFIMPEEFDKMASEYRTKNKLIEDQIASLKMQEENLTLRIQLASDKVLQKMVNEIDDMGDLSLMDTKIKLLNG